MRLLTFEFVDPIDFSNQTRNSAYLFVTTIEPLFRYFPDTIYHGFNIPFQGRQRRSDFMGNIGGQTVSDLLLVLKLQGKIIH